MKTYVRHKIMNVIDVKELVASEYLDFEGKYRDYSEKHNFCELCYVESGDVTLFLDGVEYTLGEGDAMLISAGVRHMYKSAEGNLSRVYVICFECQSHMLKFLSGHVIPMNDDERHCIKKIGEECVETFFMNDNDLLEVLPHPNFGGQQAVILHLEYLLISFLRRRMAEKKSGLVLLDGEKFYEDLVDIILSYLKNNVSERLSLEKICQRFNYSRSFICKVFKEETGESLISYFNNLKIEEARGMLLETEMTVSEISEALGFSEAKYFGDTFKKKVGLSPQNFRLKFKT